MSASRERRRWSRTQPAAGGPTSLARLRGGGDLRVRDISCGGARVDGQARLLPGVHADVHLVGAMGRQLVRGRVVWSRVRAVGPVVYESALVFDAPFELLPAGYDLPGDTAPLSAAPVARYPRPAEPRHDAHESSDKRPHERPGTTLGS